MRLGLSGAIIGRSSASRIEKCVAIVHAREPSEWGILSADSCRPSHKNRPGSGHATDGQAALVTGASHGIGKAIALAFAREGADLVFTFRGREDGARGYRAADRAAGPTRAVRRAEVTDLDDCPRVVDEAIHALGGLDVLVNNAGGGRGDPLIDLTLDDWRYTLICVTAPFVLAQRAARHMASTVAGRS